MDDDERVEMSNSERLGALLESAQQAAKEYEGMDSEDEEDMEMDEEDEDETFDLGQAIEEISQVEENGKDTSRKAFDKIYKQVVDEADVILYVLDARNPEGTRSKSVERAVLSNTSKRLLFVLNKIDLVPKETLQKWVKHLELSFPTIPLIASNAAPNAHTFNHKQLTAVSTATNLLQSLKKYASASNLKRSISVGVIGYPNVGKSSVVNALLGRHSNNSRACPVGAQAGVTTSIRKVKIDNKLNLIDSPGIVFPSESGKNRSPVDQQARLVLLNALPPKQITDPRPAVSLLLKRLSKNKEQLDYLYAYYDLPPLVTSPHDAFLTSFLVHVCRKKGRLGKGGVPDLLSAATAVINDWRDGRICGWALPPLKAKTTTGTLDTDISNNISKDSMPSSEQSSEQTVIVNQWAKEFSLDGLWDGTFDD